MLLWRISYFGITIVRGTCWHRSLLRVEYLALLHVRSKHSWRHRLLRVWKGSVIIVAARNVWTRLLWIRCLMVQSSGVW